MIRDDDGSKADAVMREEAVADLVAAAEALLLALRGVANMRERRALRLAIEDLKVEAEGG